MFQGPTAAAPRTELGFQEESSNSGFSQSAALVSETRQESSVAKSADCFPTASYAAISPITPAAFGPSPPLVALTATMFFPVTSTRVRSTCAGAPQLSDFATDFPLMNNSNELSTVIVAMAWTGGCSSVQARRR